MAFQEISIYSGELSPVDMEILIASLYDLGFDGFTEEDKALKAYIPAGLYTESQSGMIRSFFTSRNLIPRISSNHIPDTNWNEEWERNYPPVIIDNRCAVKASFHSIPDLDYNIIINPEMSFGTGHHETTRMMIRNMLDFDFSKLKILDMGCGTGILGILAAKLGAASVTSIDIDLIACNNTTSNFHKNNIFNGFTVLNGDGDLLKDKYFDVILANINRNIILKDINSYARSLSPHGMLIISGILIEDEVNVRQHCEKAGLHFISSTCENRWISITLTR